LVLPKAVIDFDVFLISLWLDIFRLIIPGNRCLLLAKIFSKFFQIYLTFFFILYRFWFQPHFLWGQGRCIFLCP